MKVFCCFLKEETWKKFSISADVFISKKKKKITYTNLLKNLSPIMNVSTKF